MGEKRDRCAVDSFGKVYGTDRLYVVDASLLCGPTVVNPQGSVMALAHRNTVEFLSR
jgi:choline dehydrogenase-like flavoprotein